MPLGIGIDIGEAAIRAAVVERRGSEIRLMASAEIPYASREDLVPALSRVRALLSIRRSVVLGLPTSAAIVATVHPLIVHPQRAGLAVAFELQQHLPCDVSQTAWHYAWLIIESRGGRLAAGPGRPAVAAAVKRSIVEARLLACRQAGISVEAVSVTAVALANVWRAQAHRQGRPGASGAAPDANGDTVILWWDRGSAEWVRIGSGGVRVVPVALPRQDVPASGALPAPFVQALRRAWEDIARPEPSMIRLAGEAAASTALADAIRREWSRAVEPVDPASILSLSPAAPANPERLLPAVGLAFQGLGAAPAPLNLIADLQEQRRRAHLARGAQAVGIASAVAAVCLGFHAMWTLRERRQTVLDQLLSQERLAQQLRPEIRQQLKRQASVMERTRQLEELTMRRLLVAQALQRVTEALPDDMWLTSIHLAAQQDMLSGTIEGVSRSFQGVTKFMDALKSSVGWDTVKPLTTTVTTQPSLGTDVVTFAVQVQQPLAKVRQADAHPAPSMPRRPAAAPRNPRAPRRTTPRTR